MNDVWNGEARGCSDVVFTRLGILEEDYSRSCTSVEATWNRRMMQTIYFDMDIESSVMSLIYQCKKQNVKLVDLLTGVYLSKKEEYNA